MINVLLVEDSAVFVMGLKLALSAEPSFGSIESVASPGAAVAFLNAHPETDIAVVDITLEKARSQKARTQVEGRTGCPRSCRSSREGRRRSREE